MKKSIGILITAILLFTAACGLSEEESSLKFFTPGLTNTVTSESSMGMDSALNIMADKEKRAILTVCLAFDFSVTDEGKEFTSENIALFLINDSYVSCSENSICLRGHANGKVLTFFYTPGLETAAYFVFDAGLPDAQMNMLVKEIAESEQFYFKNDTSDLMEVMNVISGAVGN